MHHSKHVWIVEVLEEGSASIEVDGRQITPIPAWTSKQTASRMFSLDTFRIESYYCGITEKGGGPVNL